MTSVEARKAICNINDAMFHLYISNNPEDRKAYAHLAAAVNYINKTYLHQYPEDEIEDEQMLDELRKDLMLVGEEL